MLKFFRESCSVSFLMIPFEQTRTFIMKMITTTTKRASVHTRKLEKLARVTLNPKMVSSSFAFHQKIRKPKNESSKRNNSETVQVQIAENPVTINQHNERDGKHKGEANWSCWAYKEGGNTVASESEIRVNFFVFFCLVLLELVHASFKKQILCERQRAIDLVFTGIEEVIVQRVVVVAVLVHHISRNRRTVLVPMDLVTPNSKPRVLWKDKKQKSTQPVLRGLIEKRDFPIDCRAICKNLKNGFAFAEIDAVLSGCSSQLPPCFHSETSKGNYLLQWLQLSWRKWRQKESGACCWGRVAWKCRCRRREWGGRWGTWRKTCRFGTWWTWSKERCLDQIGSTRTPWSFCKGASPEFWWRRLSKCKRTHQPTKAESLFWIPRSIPK